MAFSSLVNKIILSPNMSIGHKHVKDRVSIHCMAGNLSIESCGELFKRRKASSNYGIGSDGRIGGYVDENNRSWCTSSSSNDDRAITIEVANTQARYPWPVSDKAYSSLIDLLVDICKRHNKKKLLWIEDKDTALVYTPKSDEMLLTVHRWFAAKECPGEWLYSRHGEIADIVTAKLKEDKLVDDNVTWDKITAPLRDNDAGDWSKEARQWAIDNKLIAGDGGTPVNYMWGAPVTREQLMVFLYRWTEWLKAGG